MGGSSQLLASPLLSTSGGPFIFPPGAPLQSATEKARGDPIKGGGKYIGRRKTNRLLAEEERKALFRQAEEELAADLASVRVTRATRILLEEEVPRVGGPGRGANFGGSIRPGWRRGRGPPKSGLL